MILYKKLSISREGINFIVPGIILLILSFFLFRPLVLIFLLYLTFMLIFFRDPDREIPLDNNTIVSPADGLIKDIKIIFESSFLHQEAYKITIFLSIFNVHVNRSPLEGIIEDIRYRSGKYLPAFKSHASDINERNIIYLKSNRVKLIVKQITGFLARRIVCYLNSGDSVEKGEKIGIIKFGSATEIIIPKEINICIKKGDRVIGGETVIGVIGSDI